MMVKTFAIACLLLSFPTLAQRKYLSAHTTSVGDIGDVVGGHELLVNKTDNQLLCEVKVHKQKNGSTDFKIFGIDTGDWGTWTSKSTISTSVQFDEEISKVLTQWFMGGKNAEELCQVDHVFDEILKAMDNKLPLSLRWDARTKPNTQITFTCSYSCIMSSVSSNN